MPSTKNTNLHPVVQPTPINIDDHRTDAEMEAADEVERLKAERDQLNKQLRALTKKAPPAKPALTLLEVEARQSEFPAIYICDVLTEKAAARVKAGATPEYAITGVLTLYRGLVEQALDTCLETGEPIADVTARMLGRTRGHRSPKAE